MMTGTNASLAQVVCGGTAADGTEVNVIYNVQSETPLGGGICDYVLTVTIETVDGNPTPSAITANSTITADGNVDNITITLAAGQSSNQQPNVPMSQSLPCGLTGNITTQIVGGSSCVDQAAMLPVELISFETAPMEGNMVKLVWETASEIDNLGFEIQRSTDAYKWENLAFVKGNGTALERNKYEWVDVKPLANSYSYYRLKQIDTDDDFEYSEILVFKAVKDGTLNSFPNPVNNHIMVELEQTDVSTYDMEVQLFNIIGRQIRTSSVEVSGNQLYLDNLDDLEVGTYFLIISSENTGARYKVKFTKD